MLTKKNLKKHEFMGLEVEVLKSKNETQKGIKGKVVYETQKIIEIESKNGEKNIQKSGSVFKFTLPNGEKMKIIGNEISVRPEERIRKVKNK